MAPRKGRVAKEEQVISLGPQVCQDGVQISIGYSAILELINTLEIEE